MTRPGTRVLQCSLCTRLSVVSDIGESDPFSPELTATRRIYCSVCGGELYGPADDLDSVAEHVRELEGAGYALAMYGEAQNWWAAVGPPDNRTTTLFGGRGTTPLEAASKARAFAARVLTPTAPQDARASLGSRDMVAQWVVLDDEPHHVGLKVWRGDVPAFDGLATGTPDECIKKARMRLDG